MTSTLEAFREHSLEKGIALGVTRIGVHAGPAIVGISAAAASSITPRTATPSMSRRAGSREQQLGTRICVSATAHEQRSQVFPGRPVGDLMLRGKTEALRVFEPLPARSL